MLYSDKFIILYLLMLFGVSLKMDKKTLNSNGNEIIAFSNEMILKILQEISSIEVGEKTGLREPYERHPSTLARKLFFKSERWLRENPTFRSEVIGKLLEYRRTFCKIYNMDKNGKFTNSRYSRTGQKVQLLNLTPQGRILLAQSNIVDKYARTKDAIIEDLFFGRKKELRAIQNFIENDDKNILVLTGFPGVGKTRLTQHFLENILPEICLNNKQERPIFHYACKSKIGNVETERATKLTFALSEFMRDSLGMSLHDFYHSPNHEREKLKIARILPVFIIDDFQNASQGIATALEQLISVIIDSNMKFIAISREKIFSKLLPERKTVNITLHPFNRRETHSFLIQTKKMGIIDNFNLNETWNLTSGIPILLEIDIYNPERISSESDDINKYFKQKIFSKLTIKQKEILGLIVLHDEPLEQAFFEEYKDLDIEDLLRRKLIYQTISGRFDSHDSIKKLTLHYISNDSEKK